LGTVELTVKVEIKGNSPADIPEQKYILTSGSRMAVKSVMKQ